MFVKKVSMLVALAVCLFLVNGGQIFGESQPLEGMGLAPTTDETVHFIGWQYKTHIVQELVDQYNNELGGHVEYTVVTGNYPSIMETKLIAKAPIDVFFGNASQACRFYEAGWTMSPESMPNIERIKADMYAKYIGAYSYKGKLVGLSRNACNRGLIHVNLKKLPEAGLTEADFPANWDELYDQLYVIREKGTKYPYLPHWFNEWYGISWSYVAETLNRGTQIADPETHKPLVTVDGPAGDTLRAWKRIWNDGLIPEEVLGYLEADHLGAWGSGEYVYSQQTSYDLKRFNDPRYSRFAGSCTLLPYQGQSWGFHDPTLILISNRPRSADYTRDVIAFASWYAYRDHEDEFRVKEKWIEESNIFSSFKPVMENPKTKTLMEEFLARPQDYETAIEVWLQTPIARGFYNVVWAPEFNTWLKETLQKFLLDDKPVDETINAMRDKIDEFNTLYGIS